MKDQGTAPEFSRVIVIQPDMGAGDDAETFAIEATADERAALARRFGLLGIAALKAEGRIDVSARGRRARLSGHLRAEVTQACVVTLAPVAAVVEDEFVVTYDRDAERPKLEEDFDIGADDPPDPLPDDGIDVGEAVAEHFGLALDPYPRAPGAALPAGDGGAEGETGKTSPFAVLARLKRPGSDKKA